jgi:DNA processing protein
MQHEAPSLSLFEDINPAPAWERTEDEIACALELNTLNSFRTQFRRLRTKYHSFRAMYEATDRDLAAFPDWATPWRNRFVEQKGQLRPGEEYSRVPKDVAILTYFDNDFPSRLREIYDPPPVIYVRGDLSYDYATSLSIVGSRSYTDYGRGVAEKFAYQLASWGFTIISGGARGIDSLGHRACLAAGGKTIAVLGNGMDVVFPVENRKLFARIAEQGALITEFPMGTVPEKYNFPARNRLIAAMSRGTLIVEAPEKSGALITADLALQNGREVFAVPGRLTDGRSKGTNQLIHDGAHVALDPTDIPIRFGLTVLEGEEPDAECMASRLTGDEAIVYEAVGLEAREADALVREIGIPAARVLSALLVLQTRGLVKELPGSRFVRPVFPLAKPALSQPDESAS